MYLRSCPTGGYARASAVRCRGRSLCARQRADDLPGGGGRRTPTRCPCRNSAVISPGTGQGTVRAKELHLEIVSSS